MAEHIALKEGDKECLKKDGCKDVKLLGKLKQDRPALLNMLNESLSSWNELVWRVNVAEHRNDLLNDKVRPVSFTLYRAGLTVRQLSAAEISLAITKKFIEPETTE